MKFEQHIEYKFIPEACKGKRKAFEKGWKAKLNGNDKNPYKPRMKGIMPTNPYFKYWSLGYECCSQEKLNNH